MGCALSATAATQPGGFVIGEHVFYRGAPQQGWSGRLVFGASGQVVYVTFRGSVAVMFGGGIGRVTVEPLELCRTVPRIPSGFSFDDIMYYGGPAREYSNGDAIQFGQQGSIAGLCCLRGDPPDGGQRLAVLFPGHRMAKALQPALLSSQPPTIPGGYSVGDRVYWCGMNWTFPNGDRLKFGSEGEVAGRSCVGDGLDDRRVAVSFRGNRGAVAMRLPEISSQYPVIPGGYNVGDQVYYAFPNWKSPNGSTLQFGVQGKVIGRSCIGDGKDDERIWVLFPGLSYGCICLEQISLEPPMIPGHYNLGDPVYYCGPSRPVGSSDQLLVFGSLGEVAGRAASGTQLSGQRALADVAVVFPGSLDAVDVRLLEISRGMPVIPGGLSHGDRVFYCGGDRAFGNGDRITFGSRGEVVGRSCQGDGQDDERVAVVLPGNRLASDLRLEECSGKAPPNLLVWLEERLAAAERKAACPTPRRARSRSRGGDSLPGRPSPSSLLALVEPDASPQASRWGDGAGAAEEPTADSSEVVPLSVQTPSRAVQFEGLAVIGGIPAASPSVAGAAAEQTSVITELAIVRRTALAADLGDLAAAAQRAALAQVELGRRSGDLALLAELRRAAEEGAGGGGGDAFLDGSWQQELWSCANSALEEVAMPQVLTSAGSEGDVFGQLAVRDWAKARGFSEIVGQAEELLQSSQLPDSFLQRQMADRLSGSEPESGPEAARVVEQMQLLLNETYTGWGGFGKLTRTRDRPDEKVADHLEVECVVHLRNKESYLNYCIRRQVIACEMPEYSRRDWNVRTSSSASLSSASVSSPSSLSDAGGPGCGASPHSGPTAAQPPSQDFPKSPGEYPLSVLDPSFNEHYLWHGTGPAEARGIAERGFDLGQAGSSRGALFGRGLYFAESCLKADEYVRPDAEGRFPLILCRVTLGHVNYCDAEDPWELRESLRFSCRHSSGEHHSVIGDREKIRQTFREFVIFDAHQAYPEYIVWYRRK
ncbi:unnamed protein product [Polarella glacialis]|uniref:Poly [ADP-ribose] polymerase n=1 Tax=Polarella glacialis TaxID=89957 RepID=A0A813H3R0_POLGL|nr:unnamed protein product [Polarella glacialis]